MNPKTTAGIVILAAVLLGLPIGLKLKREHDLSANTYRLVSVDDHALPFAARQQGRQGPEIVSSTINLYSGGTFRATMTYKNPAGGTTTRDFKGTYSGKEAISSLKWEGAGETPITLEDNKLTVDNGGVPFVYEK